MRARVVLASTLSLLVLFSPGMPARGSEAEAASGGAGAEPLPGVQLAEALATATGIAITPLLGVSVVGAWKAWKTPPELRDQLPWYASRWFWIPGLVLALLLVFKDPLLGLVPGAKKPLDAVDVIENKASAVLAAPAVVPMFLSAVAAFRGVAPAVERAAPQVSQAGLAALPALGDLPEVLALGIGSALFLAAFFCVWLAFHAINVLILLSPFGPLDMALRMIKLFTLAVLVGSTLIHPYLGVLVALGILAVSIPIAGWSFRLTVFGGVLAADLVTWRHRRVKVEPRRLRAFVEERQGKARTRTYGWVSSTEAGLCFSYRPWLVLPRRTIVLPEGSYVLGRGLVCPLIRLRESDGDAVEVLRLPPRYRHHDEEVVRHLGLAGVEDLALRRGIKAVVAFVKEMAGRGGRGVERPA